jgi:ornithine carbamoyltransferase
MAMKNVLASTSTRSFGTSGFRTRVTRSAASSNASGPTRNSYPKDFLSLTDLDAGRLEETLRLSARLKQERRLGRRAPTAQALASVHVALLFEKPSLRTHATFEIAVRELGGDVIAPSRDVAMGSRETPADVARNLERWVAAVVMRTFAQERLRTFAAAAPKLHVVNALSNEEHPCQTLADLLTLRETWGSLRDRTITYVGDGNNVATSLVHGAMLSGMHVRVSSPDGFELPSSVVEDAERLSVDGATLTLVRDPREAVTGTGAVYTDVWTSMGQESEEAERRRVFLPYQVNGVLMSYATPDTLFMHCLPAHRGDEVTDEVMDAPSSVVFDQAENRLHVQKALLLTLLTGAR